jgi:NAD(P)-dependent dehydrogenase (short-subunit alcohol dehydrogenase family)
MIRFFGQKALADPQSSFAGRNVLITGANTGLGFEAAVKTARLGASQVVLGVRDLRKGERARQLIEQRTGNAENVSVWHLDMNSYESIKSFATRAAADLDHLDVAILNAGVYSVNFHQSPYGWEETFQVNVISTALLALLLLPKLQQSPGLSKLEFVSSWRHEVVNLSDERRQAPNLLESFNNPETFKSSESYQASKLFVMCIVQRLASVVNPSSNGVSMLAVCPGFCQSDLSRGHQGIAASILRGLLNSLILRTTEQGARTLVSGAVLGPESHGKFWLDDELHQM